MRLKLFENFNTGQPKILVQIISEDGPFEQPGINVQNWGLRLGRILDVTSILKLLGEKTKEEYEKIFCGLISLFEFGHDPFDIVQTLPKDSMWIFRKTFSPEALKSWTVFHFEWGYWGDIHTKKYKDFNFLKDFKELDFISKDNFINELEDKLNFLVHKDKVTEKLHIYILVDGEEELDRLIRLMQFYLERCKKSW